MPERVTARWRPSAESVNENLYPISRPLYMYTSQAAIDAKPQIAEFVAFYLNNVNDVISEVGYFPAPEESSAGGCGSHQGSGRLVTGRRRRMSAEPGSLTMGDRVPPTR